MLRANCNEKMILRRVFLSTILIVNFLLILGQSRGKISGSVVNATTREAINYASITLLDQGSGKAVNGALTDTNGVFVLKNIVPGNYIVKAEFIGFKTFSRNNVVVGSKNVNLGVLLLAPSSAYLKEVTVTGSRPLVENHIDKIVYNAANDLTSQSGVALDVLKKVPSVSVDVDGNVELEGDPNIRFLINGKPSTIFGSSLADALQSIPASQIQSIEVITSPGAKYDASGTGGIINIILKESKVQGINGTLNASVGTRLENGSFNLNVRRNKLGFNAFFSGNEQLNTTTLTIINRQSSNATDDTLTNLYQNGSTAFRRSGYQTGVGVQWDLTSKDKLSASFNYNHFGNNSNGFTNQQQQVSGTAGNVYSNIVSTLNSGSRVSENAVDWSLDYYPGGIPGATGSSGNSPGTDKETDISMDYSQPLGKGCSLETGVKGVFEWLTNVVMTDTLLADKTYGSNANQSYGFRYSRQIYAYYISSSFTAFHAFLEGKAGLRYEYTNTTADFPGTHIPAYGILSPSVVVSHKFDETQSIKASYSYRIERPNYGDLNPFYNISDPHNISTGNPGLKPEQGHRYELGYNRTFGNGGDIYIAALYRYNTEDIQSFSTYYSSLVINGATYTDVSLTERFNLGSQRFVGGNFFGSLSVTPALSLRSNINIGERSNQNPGLPTVSGFIFRGNLNATYKFGHDLIAEVFGNYNSSQKTIQGTRPAFGFYTLAVRKEFFHKKASLGFTATNPFTRYVTQRSILYGTNFYQTGIREAPYQSFGLTLSFKFGKLEFKGKEHAPAKGEGMDDGAVISADLPAPLRI